MKGPQKNLLQSRDIPSLKSGSRNKPTAMMAVDLFRLLNFFWRVCRSRGPIRYEPVVCDANTNNWKDPLLSPLRKGRTARKWNVLDFGWASWCDDDVMISLCTRRGTLFLFEVCWIGVRARQSCSFFKVDDLFGFCRDFFRTSAGLFRISWKEEVWYAN